MFTELERTEERVAAYLDALKWEKKGYKDKAKRAGVVKDDASVALYTDRASQVDDEIKRVSAAPKAEKSDKDGSDQ